MFKRIIPMILFFGVLAQPSFSQPVITLSDEAHISLITMDPGNQVHNLFGHSALRVRDPYHGFDLLYNYGTFQFDNTFLPKFIYGQLDYMLWVSDIRRELQKYQNDSRSVIEQTIRLNQDQKQAVFDFLQVNALKENRVYRYDFLFDNCSTRIRDVFEHVLGDSLTFAQLDTSPQSFRKLLDPYIQSKPFLDAGIDLALALPTDEIASNRETMFLPFNLLEAFDNATVQLGGDTVSLVSSKKELISVASIQKSSSPAILYATTWLIFLIALWVSNGKSSKALATRKWFDRLLFGFCGIAGVLALFLWIVALHTVTNYNWNLLWAWPTHLAAIWAFSRSTNWLKPYMRVAAFVAFIAVLGWYIWPQEMHVAFIPLILAVAVRSIWWGWGASDNSSNTTQAAVA